MFNTIKIYFLTVCKWAGLFRISGFIYRKKLNILGYHGFSYDDEHLYHPGLFLNPATFESRIGWLKKHNFNVFTLDDALARLKSGDCPEKSVAITIDDGFRSVMDMAVPILNRYGLPVTVYVTTYYAEKESPIFRLVIQYMDWKTEVDEAEKTKIYTELTGGQIKHSSSKHTPMWKLIDYGEKELTEAERVSLSLQVSDRLKVDYKTIEQTGMMTLLTKDDIARLSGDGIDIQLHTHRHCLPVSAAGAGREISQNRDFLEPIVGRSLNHFCYPSGIWEHAHWAPLQELGIVSATTCDPGLNSDDTPPLGLKRFLDRDDLSQIEFEAELYCFKELLRNIRSMFTLKPR